MSTVATDIAEDLTILQSVLATGGYHKDVMNLKIPRVVASALVLALMGGQPALAAVSRALQCLLLDLFRKRHVWLLSVRVILPLDVSNQSPPYALLRMSALHSCSPRACSDGDEGIG